MGQTQNEQTNEAEIAETITPDEVELAQAQANEYKEALQRERADFQNYRKRVDREKESLQADISAKVLARFLPILDDFERALDSIPPDQKDSDWLKGLGLIHRKFQSMMEAEGIQALDPLGQEFDPKFHEAIGADDASEEYASGQVSKVLQKGYLRGDKVLRPAMVRVVN